MKKQSSPIKFPVGKSNFRKIIEGNYCFVDKTPFIKEAVENISETSLITRPRRFGKTLTLSMMYYFLEMGILEKDHENLFDKFEISQDKAFFVKNIKIIFPVIFITFKEIEAATYEECNGMYSIINQRTIYCPFSPFLYEEFNRS